MYKNNYLEMYLLLTLVALASNQTALLTNVVGRGGSIIQLSYEQNAGDSETNNNKTFYSGFSTFVIPGSYIGYREYQEHKSNIFKPIDQISLYVEPIGFSYQALRSENYNRTLYVSNFTVDIFLYDKSTGELLEQGQITPLPALSLLPQKVSIVIDVNLQSPIPTGDYILKYVMQDIPSGRSFEITKDIKIYDTPARITVNNSNLKEDK